MVVGAMMTVRKPLWTAEEVSRELGCLDDRKRCTRNPVGFLLDEEEW
jgi:hypothetical protein